MLYNLSMRKFAGTEPKLPDAGAGLPDIAPISLMPSRMPDPKKANMLLIVGLSITVLILFGVLVATQNP